MEAKNIASFLGQMLRFFPEDRSTAQQLLQHPWLRGLPCPELQEMAGRIPPQPPLALPANSERDHRHRGDHDSTQEAGNVERERGERGHAEMTRNVGEQTQVIGSAALVKSQA